jgi:hypothetical protein
VSHWDIWFLFYSLLDGSLSVCYGDKKKSQLLFHSIKKFRVCVFVRFIQVFPDLLQKFHPERTWMEYCIFRWNEEFVYNLTFPFVCVFVGVRRRRKISFLFSSSICIIYKNGYAKGAEISFFVAGKGKLKRRKKSHTDVKHGYEVNPYSYIKWNYGAQNIIAFQCVTVCSIYSIAAIFWDISKQTNRKNKC